MVDDPARGLGQGLRPVGLQAERRPVTAGAPTAVPAATIRGPASRPPRSRRAAGTRGSGSSPRRGRRDPARSARAACPRAARGSPRPNVGRSPGASPRSGRRCSGRARRSGPGAASDQPPRPTVVPAPDPRRLGSCGRRPTIRSAPSIRTSTMLTAASAHPSIDQPRQLTRAPRPVTSPTASDSAHVQSHLRTRPEHEQAADLGPAAFDAAAAAGDTATVRRIVARLEALPPSGPVSSRPLPTPWPAPPTPTSTSATRRRRSSSAPAGPRARSTRRPAVLVAEMAKLQAQTVGGTEDYVVTREFASSPPSSSGSTCCAPASSSLPRAARSRPRSRPRSTRSPRSSGSTTTRERDPGRVPRAPLVRPGRPADRRGSMTVRAARGPSALAPRSWRPSRSCSPRCSAANPVPTTRAPRSSSRSRSSTSDFRCCS